MNPSQLAGLIKRIYPSFDMTIFLDRLKLQKIIYLIQESGINLGYTFRLYLHGPYSTKLAKDGFNMPKMEECAELKFENLSAEEVFQNLMSFLGGMKENKESMEILASLHLFHKLFPEKSDEELIQAVKEKNIQLADKERIIKDILIKLKEFNLVRW